MSTPRHFRRGRDQDLDIHMATGKSLLQMSLNALLRTQVGRAVAAILGLPVTSESNETSLATFQTKIIYVNSFTLSQKDKSIIHALFPC
jgi:hypothetical protein